MFTLHPPMPFRRSKDQSVAQRVNKDSRNPQTGYGGLLMQRDRCVSDTHLCQSGSMVQQCISDYPPKSLGNIMIHPIHGLLARSFKYYLHMESWYKKQC